ncbi:MULTISPECIES: hypothetical protein [unclassified Veillonella]|uniref:hypothetical protein n=1 Tax=unclassified Veillonella TaxID=2630086 RepID=UPI000F8D0469|nr:MULTISPECIES: hypothetical protein [unclassified Veillonella]
MEQLEYNNETLAQATNVQEEVEMICRWAAARAAGIAALPKFNYAGLLANDVYMVSRIAKVYGVCPAKEGITGFLVGLGGSAVAALVCTIVPSIILRVPVAAAITYGVGKMAAKWIEDGMPTCPNFEAYRQRLVDIYEYNKETVITLANTPLRDKPLGNESVDFLEDVHVSGNEYLASAKGFASSFVGADLLANMGAVKDLAVGAVSILAATVKDALEKSGNEELLDNARHAAKGVGSLLKILAVEALSLTGAAASTSASKASVYTKAAYEKADTVRQTLNDSLQTTVEPVVEKATAVMQDVKEVVEPKLQQVKEAVEPTLQQVEEKASELTTKAIDQAQETVQDIREKAEVVKETAVELAEQTKEKAIDLAEQAKDKFKR